jgi:hypothetical protein
METENIYLDRYRRENTILDGNRNSSDLNQPVIPGNIDNLQSHLRQLVGNETKSENPGFYWAPDQRQWIPGRIKRLKEELEGLQEQFNRYAQSRLLIGEPRPQVWPADLAEKKLKAEARMAVAREEVEWLQAKIQEAKEQRSRARPSLLTHPRYWSAGSLENGQLVQIGPWRVAPDAEGLLRISDPDSPYNSMEVWRFKSLVVNPLNWEYQRRQREEARAADLEGRKRSTVSFPEPPTWDPENDQIEYLGISNEIIRKLKQGST